jgi:DNA gyrase subunit A
LVKRKKSQRKSSRSKSSDDRSLFDSIGDGDGGDSGAGDAGGNGNGHVVALHEAAQSRYLNYALSVITSRALPDVRDGLKPVQRRILYTMWLQRLTAETKHRKCAKVVGDVMGSFHPHGDSSIYDALVRMAQDFVMRVRLIDGSGNFGSLDGDPAAAMRYTECRLAPAATQFLTEISQQTVPFRPSYDGTKSEPVVLPSRIPNLLVNGGSGIAVGMATSIPPHNLGEVCTALIKFLDALRADRELSTAQLCKIIPGPDFPTGAQILNTAEELKQIYQTGSGSVRMRAIWEKGPTKRGTKKIYITSIPYMVNKSTLVERIAEIVISSKLPQLVDIRDISADDVRIELELKKDANDQKVMAYLCKHTPLQTNFAVNMTCLIPTENSHVGRPERLELKDILWHFLNFRLEVVSSRLEYELQQIERRIHILEGFETVFDALDQIIKIIRKSDGKADAAKKIMAKFDLDADQTDAILELKLYRLARLEILVIRKELEEKRKRAKEITALLTDEDARWEIVRNELEEILKTHGKADPRRTLIKAMADEPQYTADDFIVDEDNQVIVTRDGWVKRQKDIRDPKSTRLREGDSVLAAVAGSTRATVAFFSNFGTAYTCRIADIPASTGHGEPIQKMFKFKDGERIVAVFSLDKRAIGDITEDPKKPELCPAVHAFAATSDGYAMRFCFEPFLEPSTRNGRRYARPRKGKQVMGVEAINGQETIIAASRRCRVILCACEEINYLSGPGKGVILVKLAKDDDLLGFKASRGDRDLMEVETNRDAKKTISTVKYETTSRGGRGREIQKHGHLKRIILDPVEAPVLKGRSS